MMKTRTTPCLAAAAALTFIAGSAPAATITWGAAFEVESAADLTALAGPNARATNGGNDAGQSVGGVAFENYESGAFTAVTAEPALVTTTTASDPVLSFAQADADTYGVSTGDAALDVILATHIYTDLGSEVMTHTINGLTVGTLYQVQIVAQADDRPGTSDRTTSVDGAVTINRFADLDSDGNSHVTSVVGTFTADATTQSFTTAGAFGGGYSALIVSEVPEPGSLALLGLGSLMIARRRRGGAGCA